jgi:hypothetical protein
MFVNRYPAGGMSELLTDFDHKPELLDWLKTVDHLEGTPIIADRQSMRNYTLEKVADEYDSKEDLIQWLSALELE